MIQLNEMDFAIGQNTEGLYIKKYQDIPQQFIDDCRDMRHESTARAREYHKVASVPEVIVDKWLREGFDVYKEPAKAIVARLKTENLDYFITTKKRV